MKTIKKLLKDITNKINQENNFQITDEYKRCLELVANTKYNLFITGKAGTGKTTLIQYFRRMTNKKIIVLAPTGIAALNSKGQTIHSFFGFPPRLINLQAINTRKNNRLFKDIDTIIIDEISMVRADLLDGIDRFLRYNGKDRTLPFGGIQMIFVGDLFQLSPVLTIEESDIFNQLYESPYFFSANSFNLDDFETIELTTIFRQKELNFIDFLNTVRSGESTPESLNLINKNISVNLSDNNHITLCTTNNTADNINSVKLNNIKKPEYIFNATTEGDFPTENRNLPIDLELKLKQNARVLFVKNDKSGRWVNGTLGTIYKIKNDFIQVRIDDSNNLVGVDIEEWDNIEYEMDDKTGEIREKIIGKLKQYPLRLAWAITIHKSQGMSFNKVNIDFTRSPFAHGQTYVALSRCRSLDGIKLSKKIWPNDIILDDRIVEFHKRLKK